MRYHLALAMLFLLITAAYGQEPEIFTGDSEGLWGKDIAKDATPREEPNYLARCLANPNDRESCFLAATNKESGGLESYVDGELEIVTYIPCDSKDGVCVDQNSQDASAASSGQTSKPQGSRLTSVDITIQFDYDSDAIRADQAPKLDQLATAMAHDLNRAARFAVIGHTDGKGSDKYNCDLSRRRARAVAARFSDLGLDMARFLSLGAGEHLLKNPADSEAAENRRVGFARLKSASEGMIDQIAKLCRN